MNPMFPVLPEMFGKAVKDAQPEGPVAVANPVDETSGPAPDKLPTVEPPADVIDSTPLVVPPVPLIGSVPLGAVVLDSRVETCPAATTRYVGLGETGGARPGVLGVIAYVTAGAGSASFVSGKAQLHAGFPLGDAPFFYPLRNAVVKLTGEVTVAYMVIGSDLGAV